MITSLGKREPTALLSLFLVCDLCTACLGLFACPFGVNVRFCSVIAAFAGHPL